METFAFAYPDGLPAAEDDAVQTSLVTAIARCAALLPQAVAVEDGDRRLTYGELDASALRLARRLVGEGLRPGDTAAVYAPRSIGFVIAGLALMRARACLLPLDPAWPAERARDILARSGAKLVLADAEALPGLGPLETPVVDIRAAADAVESGGAPGLQEPKPGDLAYLLYTSGSTGAPKGVEIGWASFQHMIDWKARCQRLRPADRVSCLASVAFDASLTEIWPTLAVGAQVVIADDAVRFSAESLTDWMLVQRISVAAFVPPVLAERLITASWPPDTRLRLIVSAGEALRAYPKPGQPFVVLNGYGPTECTVETTVGIVPPRAEPAAGLPSIGRPIPDVYVYLLDAEDRPVRDGQVGEIHIGGANVGRGYRGLDRLTRERFLADPFSDEPGARMYRTGDLGMRLPDGEIAFYGRADDQVQIRGHRVEPAEVAGVLATHPQVAACAVIARDSGAGAELIAYVAPPAAQAPPARALREHLAERLPEYMIPARFIRLEELPLNSSGKVDRNALPAPELAESLDDTPYRAPSGPAEERLTAIFEQVLQRQGIGVDDDFFLLGGYSLLAAQILMQASEAFGVELAVPVLFSTRTVARLAAVIEQTLIEELGQMTDAEVERRLETLK
jgi:amino acid adenylation domain-containing protein